MIIFNVDNIKCGGCVNSIQRQLSTIDGVNAVTVDVAEGRVTVDAASELTDTVRQALARLGYPESGTTTGVAAIGADLRSVVSCAIGRVQGDKTD